VVLLDRIGRDLFGAGLESARAGGRDDLAYVIYTSVPPDAKGTLISHHNVVRLFEATQPWFGFTDQDVWTLFHSCAFDFSVWEIWGALFYGGRLVIVPFGLSRTPDAFLQLLRDEGVTVLNQTPSAFRQLIRADENAAAGGLELRYVVFGGRSAGFEEPEALVRPARRCPSAVGHMYGITETTVHVTYRPIGAADLAAGSVIGVPIPDLQVHLLDAERRPVPTGQPGEIYVGGEGVGRGYLNRPELTAHDSSRIPLRRRRVGVCIARAISGGICRTEISNISAVSTSK